MRSPSHVLLPIGGAVVLAAAVLGTWLWPAPPPPPVNLEPPPLATPVLAQPPSPPAPPPRLARPVVRAVPPAPSLPPVQPSRPVAVAPPAPVPEAPPPSSPPPGTDASEQEPNLPVGPYLSKVERAVVLLERRVGPLEKAREAALARGDQAEAERLANSIRKHRERLERIRARSDASPALNGGAPPPR